MLGSSGGYPALWSQYEKQSQEDESDVLSEEQEQAKGKEQEQQEQARGKEQEGAAKEEDEEEAKQGAARREDVHEFPFPSLLAPGILEPTRRKRGFKFTDNAFIQYAMAHNKQVTLQEIEKHEIGLQGWAYKHVNLGSQGPLRQSLRINLEKPENLAQKHIYKYLSPELQMKFALAWGTEKDYEFLKEVKQTEVYSEIKAGKVRQFITPQAIAGKLGDANDEELLESAYKWCDQCWNYECPEGMTWWKWSHWLGRYLFLFEWDVEEEMEGEKKSAITQISNKVNLFEQAAQERKAILNYAEKCGVKASMVSLELVKATPLGIAGWATAGEPDPCFGWTTAQTPTRQDSKRFVGADER